MGKLVQIHDVPDEVHAELKHRARRSGMSLSAFLRDELGELAGHPPLDEVLARIADRDPVPHEPGEIERSIREMREADPLEGEI